MNLCRGLVKAKDGAKIARKSWNSNRNTFLVYENWDIPEKRTDTIHKVEDGQVVDADWHPSKEELFADDWLALRGM